MARPRVLIMRSAQQASGLAEQLRARGAEPILVPVIEIAPPSSFASLDAAIARVTESPKGGEGFHWLLFTSANAVGAFQQRRTLCGGPAFHAQLRVAAVGQATARALEGIGLAPTVIAATAIAESLAEALLPHARQADGSPTRFLLPRVEPAPLSAPREVLPEKLRAAGAEVTIVPAYRNIVPGGSAAALREVFATQEHSPDAIAFTSSSAVRHLLALLAEAEIALPRDIPRVSIGSATSATLRDLGYPPDAEAAAASDEGLVEALLYSLKAHGDM